MMPPRVEGAGRAGTVTKADAAGPVDPSIAWLQPFPDAWLDDADPASIVATRDSVRLALVASLQYLPPRQRAVLILREVLGWPATEVAELLDMSVVAVKSALQRARARLDDISPVADEITQLTQPRQRELLDGDIAAVEAADPQAPERLLQKDATLEAPPLRNWYAGISPCLPYLAQHVMGDPGHWRMLPTRANGQPAAAVYYRGAGGSYRPYGIAVLTVQPDGI